MDKQTFENLTPEDELNLLKEELLNSSNRGKEPEEKPTVYATIVDDIESNKVAPSFRNPRCAKYMNLRGSESYVGVVSKTQPNASMTIEEIYARISQGKPIADSALSDMTSKRDAGYDSDARTREATLQDMWEQPYSSPEGTLDRVQEVRDRYAALIQTLQAQRLARQQQQQQQEPPKQQQQQEPQQ